MIKNCMENLKDLFSKEQNEMDKNIIQYSADILPSYGKVAVYCRVCNNENGALEKQVDNVKIRATILGDLDCDVFSEVAPGYPGGCAEFSKLMDGIRSHKYKRLYIKSVDRLSRDMVELPKVIKEIHNNGVEIIVVN